MISADLLLKGLGGVAVVGGATTVGVCYRQEKWIFAKEKKEELSTFAAKAGLNCNGNPTESAGVSCTKKTGADVKIKVKRENENIEVSSLPDNSGKIKVYKTSKGEDHNKGFKFVIEENDISGTDTSSGNKLEQFETYEIKQDGADWKLIRKTEAKDGIKKALGLDQISGCDLPSPTGCDVAGDNFKKIKFDGGSEGREVGPANAKLKITAETNKTEYPLGYKFVLESANDATIKTAVIVKGGTNTEFKIKRETGTNNISLEKAWTVKSLGSKVGLECPETVTNGTGECSLNDNKINVKNANDKKFKELSKKTESSNKKVKFEEKVSGHNQGFKFFVDDSGGIALQNGNPSSGSEEDKKISHKGDGSNSVSYQILKDGEEWYLTKVTSGGAAG